MNNDRLHDHAQPASDHASPQREESVPGRHTLTEHLHGPSRHLIDKSVGEGGRNARRDVRAVQIALARHGHSPGPIDGQIGPRTIAAIEQFQLQFLRHPDGLVEVGGVTEERLGEVQRRAPPASEHAQAATRAPSTPVAAPVSHAPTAEPSRPVVPPKRATPPGTDAATDARLAEARDAVLAVVPPKMKSNAQTSVPVLLRSCRDLQVRDPNQVAYIIATAQHESGFGATKFERSEPLVEDHNPYKQNRDGTWTAKEHLTGKEISAPTKEELEVKYWDSIYGNKLDNRRGTADAANFKGRGYVQLTGRKNYADMSKRLNDAGVSYTIDEVTYGGKGNPPIDLVANPTHVNRVPEIAAYILVIGSTKGTFTGKALDRYINKDKVDFRDARSVINGDTAKNGEAIAGIARKLAPKLQPVWSRVFEPAPAIG